MDYHSIRDISIGDYHAIIQRRYAGDPHFVYPDIGFLAKLLTGKSAYLRRGKAKAFALRDDKGVCAFGIGFVDPGLQKKMAGAVGSLGFFEACDGASATQLVNAVTHWLGEQSVDQVLAPFNANPYNGMGFRENHFETPPFVGCPHDGPLTKEFLRTNDFTPVMRYLNFDIDLKLHAWDALLASPGNIQWRNMSRLKFRRDVRNFVRLHNLAFREVWGEVEISAAEAMQMLMRSRLALHPRLFQFAALDEKIVGFVLCMANLPQVLAPLHRPLTSTTGILKILRRQKSTNSLGLLALAVDPAYQGRGIGTALVARACEAAYQLGYTHLEYALVAQENTASLTMAKRFGGKECRSFGIYQRTL